jgi:hypothetical protein
MNTTRYWFPAKPHGWGWTVPNTWQGWAVLLAYIAAVVALAHLVSASAKPLLFWALLALATLLLILIFWLKGEPPDWRWRKR